MKKSIVLLLIILITVGCNLGTTEIAECKQYGAIEASLEWIPFSDSVKQADLIAEVEILDSETVFENMCKTKHSAKVVHTLVGESEEEITFLQSGSDKVLFNQNQIFQAGDTYLLFLRQTTSGSMADYWIYGEELGTYHIDGDVLKRKIADDELASIEPVDHDELLEPDVRQVVDREAYNSLVEETYEK
ncbi:hypothetical protein [Alkalicoccobacillus gibsonii]|uniref:hypothetical protein n=1 Tax=Alkalicoccobacillus gibsonii TaxID=79881 RepID=UPI0019329079|nr:hypothetical protein [Alkalicoccobacillus gibsonii]MBM0066827.1 hypothetical protein [Alkalicoccobacillus gibsonii]